jgi:hypothetical protein
MRESHPWPLRQRLGKGTSSSLTAPALSVLLASKSPVPLSIISSIRANGICVVRAVISSKTYKPPRGFPRVRTLTARVPLVLDAVVCESLILSNPLRTPLRTLRMRAHRVYPFPVSRLKFIVLSQVFAIHALELLHVDGCNHCSPSDRTKSPQASIIMKASEALSLLRLRRPEPPFLWQ